MNRDQQRKKAYRRLLRLNGGKCPLCNEAKPTDYHELVYRSQTIYDDEAREASFAAEISACLCQSCHSEAHNWETTKRLYRLNVGLWGIDAVENALVNLGFVGAQDLIYVTSLRGSNDD